MKKIFHSLLNTINAYNEAAHSPYKIFAVFAMITYPMYWLIWHFLSASGYENLPLRLVVVLLAIPLIFFDRWPSNLKIYLGLYWYLVLCYSLPFLFTFLLLKNNFSDTAILNTLTTFILMILLTDLTSLIVILIVGISTACGIYYLSEHGFILPNNWLTIMITYSSVLVFGELFAHRRKYIYNERFNAAKLLAASIAHELRTPLASIIAGASGLQNYLPKLLHNSQRAQEEKVSDLEIIRPIQLEALQQSLTAIEKEASSSNLIITTLLTNLSTNQSIDRKFSVLSIGSCVQEALTRYPISEEIRSKINWQLDEDFLFYGSKTLTIHILFNLLKNAIYYIRFAQRGEIFITIDTSQQQNILYFKDTSVGIDAKNLLNIFKQFYSNTRHGTGIGLAFCKTVMKSYGGDITCRSKKEVYTEFSLIFPKISPPAG